MEYETPEHLTPDNIAITEILANHLGVDVIDEGKIPSLKPSQPLQFI